MLLSSNLLTRPADLATPSITNGGNIRHWASPSVHDGFSTCVRSIGFQVNTPLDIRKRNGAGCWGKRVHAAVKNRVTKFQSHVNINKLWKSETELNKHNQNQKRVTDLQAQVDEKSFAGEWALMYYKSASGAAPAATGSGAPEGFSRRRAPTTRNMLAQCKRKAKEKHQKTHTEQPMND